MIELKGTLSRFLQSCKRQLWDKDTITFDDDLGEARVALDERLTRCITTMWTCRCIQSTVTFSVTWVAATAPGEPRQ